MPVFKNIEIESFWLHSQEMTTNFSNIWLFTKQLQKDNQITRKKDITYNISQINIKGKNYHTMFEQCFFSDVSNNPKNIYEQFLLCSYIQKMNIYSAVGKSNPMLSTDKVIISFERFSKSERHLPWVDYQLRTTKKLNFSNAKPLLKSFTKLSENNLQNK